MWAYSVVLLAVLLPPALSKFFVNPPTDYFQKNEFQSNNLTGLNEFSTVNEKECAGLCLVEHGCHGFLINNQKCFTVPKSKLPLALINSTSAYSYYELKANTSSLSEELEVLLMFRHFKRTAKYTISGHDHLGRVKWVTAVECAALCLLRDGCKSFEYKKSNRFCDMSNITTDKYKLSANRYGWDFYEYSYIEEANRTAVQEFIPVKEATVANMVSILRMDNSTILDCATICVSDDICTAFIYVNENHTCYLLNQTEGTMVAIVSDGGNDIYLRKIDKNEKNHRQIEELQDHELALTKGLSNLTAAIESELAIQQHLNNSLTAMEETTEELSKRESQLIKSINEEAEIIKSLEAEIDELKDQVDLEAALLNTHKTKTLSEKKKKTRQEQELNNLKSEKVKLEKEIISLNDTKEILSLTKSCVTSVEDLDSRRSSLQFQIVELKNKAEYWESLLRYKS